MLTKILPILNFFNSFQNYALTWKTVIGFQHFINGLEWIKILLKNQLIKDLKLSTVKIRNKCALFLETKPNLCQF